MVSAKAVEAGGSREEVRYIGVRRRLSGKYVAEIKHPLKNANVWLGTFETAEQAAMAYDEAARELRGNKTRTNFPLPDAFYQRRNVGQTKLSKILIPKSTGKSADQERFSAAVRPTLATVTGGAGSWIGYGSSYGLSPMYPYHRLPYVPMQWGFPPMLNRSPEFRTNLLPAQSDSDSSSVIAGNPTRKGLDIDLNLPPPSED